MQIRENGFVPIIVITIIAFLTLAIVGGTYFVVSFTPIFKSRASENTLDLLNKSAQNNAPAQASEVENRPTAETTSALIPPAPKGKVITITRNQTDPDVSPTAVYNLETKQKESLVKQLEDAGELIVVAGISPDRSKIFIITISKSDMSSLTTEAIPKEIPNYYLCQNPCTQVTKIDKLKVEQQLSQKAWWFPQTWVANSSNKIVITSLPQIPKVGSSFKTEISVLDVDTMELSNFLTDDMIYFAQNNFYLDPKNDLFITYNKQPNSDLLVSSYALADNKRADFPVGKILNLHSSDINLDSVGGFGPFYVAIPANEQLANIKSLSVKSIKDQDIGLALLPADLKDWYFEKRVFWSDSGNFFGVEISDSPTINRDRKLLVYAKEGTLISAITLSREMELHSLIFSPDDKRIITTEYQEEKNQSTWHIYPLDPSPKAEDEITHPLLTFPISWTY